MRNLDAQFPVDKGNNLAKSAPDKIDTCGQGFVEICGFYETLGGAWSSNLGRFTAKFGHFPNEDESYRRGNRSQDKQVAL